MPTTANHISQSRAALVAGTGYLLMLGTPFAEFYAMPKVMAGETATLVLSNISADPYFLRVAIAAYAINFIGDIIAAWGMYLLLKSVHPALSLLTAWMRIIYTVISMSALLNLVTLLTLSQNATQYEGSFLNNEAAVLLSAFTEGWRLSYLFFGICLGLMGWLIIRSRSAPKWIGVWVLLAGAGWFFNTVQPYLFPGYPINFGLVAFLGAGELALMVWLLGWGTRLKT